MIRHITIDWTGKLYEVGNLIDKFSKPTTDPIFASTCVIKLGPDRWLPQDADEIPIYTVH